MAHLFTQKIPPPTRPRCQTLTRQENTLLRQTFAHFEVPNWHFKKLRIVPCFMPIQRVRLIFQSGTSNERSHFVLNPMGVGWGGSGSVIN
jgi:hypothetical protein